MVCLQIMCGISEQCTQGTMMITLGRETGISELRCSARYSFKLKSAKGGGLRTEGERGFKEHGFCARHCINDTVLVMFMIMYLVLAARALLFFYRKSYKICIKKRI